MEGPSTTPSATGETGIPTDSEPSNLEGKKFPKKRILTERKSSWPLENTPRSKDKKRWYCCFCDNFRGKIVKGKPVSLHRFPMRPDLRKAWLKRMRSVSPVFTLKSADRICSSHFVNGPYHTPDAIPSIFIVNGTKRIFKVQQLPESEVEPVIERPRQEKKKDPDVKMHLISEPQIMVKPDQLMVPVLLKANDGKLCPIQVPITQIVSPNDLKNMQSVKNNSKMDGNLKKIPRSNLLITVHKCLHNPEHSQSQSSSDIGPSLHSNNNSDSTGGQASNKPQNESTRSDIISTTQHKSQLTTQHKSQLTQCKVNQASDSVCKKVPEVITVESHKANRAELPLTGTAKLPGVNMVKSSTAEKTASPGSNMVSVLLKKDNGELEPIMVPASKILPAGNITLQSGANRQIEKQTLTDEILEEWCKELSESQEAGKPQFVGRDKDDREMDIGFAYHFKWHWLDYKVDNVPVGKFIRKLTTPTQAYCILCRKRIKYEHGGRALLRDHCRSIRHRQNQAKVETRYIISESTDSASESTDSASETELNDNEGKKRRKRKKETTRSQSLHEGSAKKKPGKQSLSQHGELETHSSTTDTVVKRTRGKKRKADKNDPENQHLEDHHELESQSPAVEVQLVNQEFDVLGETNTNKTFLEQSVDPCEATTSKNCDNTTEKVVKAKAMVHEYLAQRSISLTEAEGLIKLSKELAKDMEVLNKL